MSLRMVHFTTLTVLCTPWISVEVCCAWQVCRFAYRTLFGCDGGEKVLNLGNLFVSRSPSQARPNLSL